jgi:hypothetical protein
MHAARIEELPQHMALSENVYQTTNMRKPAGVGIAWIVATIVAVTIAAAAVNNVRTEVTDVPTALGIAAIRAMETEPDQLDVDGDQAAALETPTTSTLAPTVESETPTLESTTTTAATTTTTRQVQTTTTQSEAVESSRLGGTTSSRPPAQPKSSSPTTTKPPTAADTTPTTVTAPITTTTTVAAPVTTTTTITMLTTTTLSPNAYTREIVTDGGSFLVRVEGDAVLFGSATTSTDSVWRFDLLNGGPQMVDVQYTSIDNQFPTIRVIVTVTNGVLDILRGPS